MTMYLMLLGCRYSFINDLRYMVTLLEKSQSYPPLTTDQVSKLRSLRAKDKPPSEVTLNMNTFRLPEGVKASLVKAKGSAGTFRIQVTLPYEGRLIGVTLECFMV
jgi:hypothetical protein